VSKKPIRAALANRRSEGVFCQKNFKPICQHTNRNLWPQPREKYKATRKRVSTVDRGITRLRVVLVSLFANNAHVSPIGGGQ